MVVLGRVLAPFGVLGWVKVEAFGQDFSLLLDRKQWNVRRKSDNEWQALAVMEAKEHGALLRVHFAGYADRDAAGTLRAAEIGLPDAELPAAAENEVYLSELAGLIVVNREGILLGRVSEVEDFGAHPVLRVAFDDAATRLIPFVAAYVDQVDLVAGRITVDWQADY